MVCAQCCSCLTSLSSNVCLMTDMTPWEPSTQGRLRNTSSSIPWKPWEVKHQISEKSSLPRHVLNPSSVKINSKREIWRWYNLVPRVSHFTAPWGERCKMRDPGNEVGGQTHNFVFVSSRSYSTSFFLSYSRFSLYARRTQKKGLLVSYISIYHTSE